MAWSALPSGEDVSLRPGDFYAFVASVKAGHSRADLEELAKSKWALVLVDYAEQGARAGLGPDPRTPDYRYVAAIVQATETGTIPWSVPWPLSMVDSSSLVQAWSAAPVDVPAGGPTPGPPSPAPRPALPSFGPLAAIVALGGAWAWYERRRHRRLSR